MGLFLQLPSLKKCPMQRVQCALLATLMTLRLRGLPAAELLHGHGRKGDLCHRPLIINTRYGRLMIACPRSVWDALLLAAFMNLRPGLYYELLSCYMGKGDKETFAAALAAVGAPFAVVTAPVGSAGVQRMFCRRV